MPSSRALVVKSLDVRRRTEAPHSGEAAMMPEKSGKHGGRNKPASHSVGVACVVSLGWP